MVSYVVICLVSYFFFYLSDYIKNRKNSVEAWIVGFVGILIISIFAGVRNLNVGIDIGVYGKNIFESTVMYGPKEAIRLYSRWADVGFVYFTYLISLFTSNFNVYLGVLEFFIQLSFFSFFRKFMNINLPSLAMLLLNIITLAWSMCMLRQTLAIAIVIWFFYFLVNKKYLSAILFASISMLFHSSVILVIFIEGILFFYSLFKEKISQKRLLILVIIITFILGYVLYEYPAVINIIIEDTTLSNIQTNNYGSPVRLFIFLAPILYFRAINKKRFVQNNFDYYLYLLCLSVLAFSWLSGINYSIGRFVNSLYPVYVLFLSIQIRRSNKKSSSIYIVIWGLIAFWWLIVRGNEGGVIPYVPYWKDYMSVVLF